MKQDPTDKTLDRFRSQLARNGLKATAQRIAVHEAMLSLGHASADMVCDWLAENSETKVTVASVYNVLTQLASLGIYSNRLSSNNKMYFDVNTKKHIHMYDRENHVFKDVVDDQLYESLLQKIGSRRFRGYTIENVDIQFVVRPTRRRL